MMDDNNVAAEERETPESMMLQVQSSATAFALEFLVSTANIRRFANLVGEIADSDDPQVEHKVSSMVVELLGSGATRIILSPPQRPAPGPRIAIPGGRIPPPA